jgi:hypothetical protein
MAIAPTDAQRLSGALAGQPSRQGQEKPRQSCGNEICHVVSPRGCPAELPIATVAVADHAVQRVDRLVDPQADRAGQGGVKERRHHAVGRVFGNSLDASPINLLGRQVVGVPADDPAQSFPRLRPVFLLTCLQNGFRFPRQAARRQTEIDQHRGQGDFGPRMPPAGQLETYSRHPADQQDHKEQQQDATEPIREMLAEQRFENLRQAADPTDRVRPTRGIAQKLVEEEATYESKEVFHGVTGLSEPFEDDPAVE